jgi:hypothetical protein
VGRLTALNVLAQLTYRRLMFPVAKPHTATPILRCVR